MIGTSVMKELIVLHHISLLENKMNIEDRNEIFNLKNATTSVAFWSTYSYLFLYRQERRTILRRYYNILAACLETYEAKYWRMDQVRSRPYPFKFFKGCLPQILLGPLLNTLSHMKGFPFIWWYYKHRWVYD